MSINKSILSLIMIFALANSPALFGEAVPDTTTRELQKRSRELKLEGQKALTVDWKKKQLALKRLALKRMKLVKLRPSLKVLRG